MYNFNEEQSILDSNEDFLLQQREAQSLWKGIAAGLIAAIIGGILWGVIVYVTNYQIGYVAVGVGLMVGYAVRTYGKGIDPIFAYTGASLAFLGCFFGKIFTAIFLLAKTENYDINFITALNLCFNPDFISLVITEGFDFIDIIFYGIAAYEGFRFSRIQ